MESCGNAERNNKISNIKITIPQVNSNSCESRIYDKRFSCYYCHKLVTKLKRHLQLKHSSEELVIEMIENKNGSEQYISEFLRHLGNFVHNINVLRNGSGSLIVVRRPSSYKNCLHYLPCQFCLGFFFKRELFKHVKSCKFSKVGSIGRKLPINAGETLLYSNLLTSSDAEFKKNIVPGMKTDDILEIITNDERILNFGEILYQKYGNNHVAYIRQCMRQLGRLIKECNKKSKKTLKLDDILNPQNLDFTIDVTREMIHSYKNSKKLKLKLGHSLKRCALIYKSKCITDGNIIGLRNVSRYLEIFPHEWENISSKALHM